MATKQRHIVNAKGKPVEVILPIAEYEKLIEAATESEADPDEGRMLKKSFLDDLVRQEKKNKRGKPLKDVVKRLGLE